MATLTLSAPAKLNLFLHITGRRADGYHNLQTLFQMLDCGDQLSFTLTTDGEIQFSCSDKSIENDSNLVVRAARLLQPSSAAKMPACIFIWIKRVPMGGGFGGGSSDAATTLLALNQLWQLKLSNAQLCELGLKLGADVPVFVFGKTAFAQGVGEKLQPVSLPENYYLIVTPDVHVSTAEVFGHPDLIRNTARHVRQRSY